MATRPKTKATPNESQALAPPPVAGGTEHRESLGRWVDDLMGDRRIHETVSADLRDVLSENVPDDPPPSQAPPPVPGGTEPVTRGAKPAETK